MAGTLRGAAAVVGIGQTELGLIPGVSAMELNAEAALAALDDAGMDPDEVDGLLVFGCRADDHTRFQALVAEHLGLRVKRYTDVTKTGGASSAGAVRSAASMIATGQCRNVLVVFGDNVGTGVEHERMLMIYAEHHHPEFELPFGPLIISLYALVARRCFHEFGWDSRMLAQAAVAARRWAQLNPAAQYRDPLSVDEVLASRMITSPLHLLDCAPISDGAAAVLVTAAEDAGRFRKPPVHIRGAASNFSYYFIHNLPNYTDFLLQMERQSSDEALAMAGLNRDDVDVLFLGDPTTICVPFNLVGTGFAAPESVGDLIASGAIAPGGRLPVNTHGGNLSCAHPGTPGQMLHVLEAVRQVRGEAGERQVPETEVAFIHGQAGVFSSHCSVVLSTTA